MWRQEVPQGSGIDGWEEGIAQCSQQLQFEIWHSIMDMLELVGGYGIVHPGLAHPVGVAMLT